MKIAILCPFFSAFYGVSRTVARQATDLVSQGHKVTIFTFQADMEPPEDVELIILKIPQGFLVQRIYLLLFPLDFLKTIRCVLKLKDFNIVYSHYYPMDWLAYLAKRLYSVKYIYYHYHFNLPEAFPTFVGRMHARLRFLLWKLLVSKADSAISISQYSSQELKRLIGLESEVIYPKIDDQRFHLGIDGAKIRRKHNLGNVPVVLNVGQTSPTKGNHLLIEAFNFVRRKMPEAKLLIVGKHPNRKYLDELIKMSDSSVIFVGPCSDGELPYYYAASDVYATASLWEGFNIPLAEAQACGKPVVAFNIGPHPEVVKDNEKGTLVPARDTKAMADAIIQFLITSAEHHGELSI